MSRNKPKKESRRPKEGSNDPIKDKVLSHPMTMRLLWTTHFNALLLKLLLLLKSVQVQSCKKKGFLSHNSQIREELWIVSKSYGYTLTMVATFRAPPTFVNTVFGTNSDWRVVWPPSSLQILFVEGNPISLQIHFLFFLSLFFFKRKCFGMHNLWRKKPCYLVTNLYLRFLFPTYPVCTFFVKVAPEACDADRYMAVSFWAY